MLNLTTNILTSPVFILILSLVFLVWLILLSSMLIVFMGNYRKLVMETTGSDLKDVWQKYIVRLEAAQKELADLGDLVKDMKEDDKKHLQKFSLVRFNPFSDTGGDQSFAISLLNSHGNGIVFSSLHGREGTRIYAKSVVNFKSAGYELSKEEGRAIDNAAKS